MILSSAILIVILYTSSLNLTINVEAQKTVFSVMPLLPIFIIFYIGCIAETNRAPFDLAEAESELVSGYMTEHSAVIFVFFFLAEYGSIVLICILTATLFLGGYLKVFTLDNPTHIFYGFNLVSVYEYISSSAQVGINIINVLFHALTSGSSLGFKACLMIFVFILARAAQPRIRFDQLMLDC